ncbi:MAG: hypothetical protein ACC628_01770 [Pirellulaceae bacterium]
MWLFASTTSWLMFTVGVVLMTVILLRRSMRYYRGRRTGKGARGRPKATAIHDFDRDQPLLDAPPEVLRWQVEMHEMARGLKAELDSKMGALQVLVQLAREESERLEQAVARAKRLGMSECNDTLAEIERLADRAMADGPDATGALPPLSNAASGLPGKKTTTRQLIYRLADQGLSAENIAQQAGIAIGEAEMILNLRPIRRTR